MDINPALHPAPAMLLHLDLVFISPITDIPLLNIIGLFYTGQNF